MIGEASRQLPLYALAPITAVLFAALLFAMRGVRPASGKFLMFIVWLRYVMQAFHTTTYQPIAAGASLNAVASLFVCVVGGVIIARRLRMLTAFPFIGAMMTLILASSLLHGLFVPAIETILKWGYFIIVMLCAYDCFKRDGDTRVLGPMLWAVAPPIAFQLASIVLGVSKATESDGSVSFIGGFNHEAAFSITMVTGFLVATLAPRLHPLLRIILLAYGIMGIVMANYRTSLVALAPIAMGYLTFSAARPFRPRDRLLIAGGALLIAVSAFVGSAALMQSRFTDLSSGAVTSELIKPPNEFSEEEKNLLSGRLYLWNVYYDQYRAGGEIEHILGYGADSWEAYFGIYAHNTLVSYLFEYGPMGVALILLIWASMLARAFSVRDPWMRGQLVSAHGGFILLNFATMPFWQIEGLMMYGLLCGVTLYYSTARNASPAPARRAAAPLRYSIDVARRT